MTGETKEENTVRQYAKHIPAEGSRLRETANNIIYDILAEGLSVFLEKSEKFYSLNGKEQINSGFFKINSDFLFIYIDKFRRIV